LKKKPNPIIIILIMIGAIMVSKQQGFMGAFVRTGPCENNLLTIGMNKPQYFINDKAYATITFVDGECNPIYGESIKVDYGRPGKRTTTSRTTNTNGMFTWSFTLDSTSNTSYTSALWDDINGTDIYFKKYLIVLPDPCEPIRVSLGQSINDWIGELIDRDELGVKINEWAIC
jgi:hypothetical protein